MNKIISPSLGILDWGIGGLGFYSLLKRNHLDIPVRYWSDAGEIPYGKLSAPALRARVERVILRLAADGATHVVVACNAASTILPRIRRRTESFPYITGVIEHGIHAAHASRSSLIGIVGGRRTILSGIYRRGLSIDGRIIRQRVAQPLSAHIEAGNIDSDDFLLDLRRIMKPLRDVDALVLACTHYTAIADRFQELAPEAVIIDPAEQTTHWVEAHWELPRGSGGDVFLTTGDPESMKSAARKVFGVVIRSVERVDVS